MIVDLDDSAHRLALDVDEPLRLPLAAPELIKIHVDARDVNLKVSILVEAHACSCFFLFVSACNIRFNFSTNAVPIT